ncbi:MULTISPECIES: FAD-dependent oxidoreductase [Agrobacterium]|uniref:FAD-dependent oxidoreductase n=1 Tax=Agrobacterium TaxID=357 RepID=UPI003BA118C1
MDQKANNTSQHDFFDVVIIGGGVNGTASARELARAGYKVMLAEADDFASGASGRSSRMLHCGLRYFETPSPVWDAISQPRRFGRAVGMARDAMIARDELASDNAVKTRAIELNFPTWREGPFASWQLDLGLRLLDLIGPGKPPLDRKVRDRVETLNHPIGRHLRSPHTLRGTVSVREYLFASPDRLCIDNALDAERHGAQLLLRTRAKIISRDDDGLWRVLLETSGDGKDVKARCVLNMAGTWSDEIATFGKRLIKGTKGAHIIIRLPDGFANKGIATLHRGGYPFYGLPLGDDRFYFGPTETLFEGDARDVFVDNEDIDFLLGEANFLLPGLNLKRSDVEQVWAGVRPLTEDPDRPMGARERVVHDLKPQGFENILAMTAGPVMSHRSAGRIMLREVHARIGAPVSSAAPTLGASDQSSDDPEIRAVTHEHAANLYGVLVHRTGAVWNGLISSENVAKTAAKLAPYFGWDAQRTNREIADFLSRQESEFCVGEEN